MAKDAVLPSEVLWDGFADMLFTVLGAVLLAGAIRLFQRRASAGLLHRVFAFGMIALGAAEIMVGPGEALTGGRPRPIDAAAWAVAWAIALAYPYLCLFWFSRKAVRSQLRAWDVERGQASAPVQWPMVVGVLSLSLGSIRSLVALAALVGAAGSLAELADPAGETHRAAVLDVLARSAALVIELCCVAAGVQLLCRRRSARALHIVYGVLGVQAGVVNSALSLTVLAHPQYDTMVAGSLLAYVYPVFCIIWFSRRAIRNQLKTWTQACAAAVRPVRWPKAVGIASCLIAGIQLPIVAWLGVAGTIKVHTSASSSSQTQFNYLADPFVLGLGVGALIVLLVGGLQLLRRKTIARPLHLIYGAAALALGVEGAIFTCIISPPHGAPPDVAASFYSGKILVLLYPAFCLVWFLRKGIREQVRSWGREPARRGGSAEPAAEEEGKGESQAPDFQI